MAPPQVPTNLLSPGVVIDSGRYHLIRTLGEGGGGVVWLALHTKMQSHVAIKFPHLDNCGTDAKFQQEISLHVKFSNQHPHYVSILDVGSHGTQLYIVMQYLANGCLADRIFSGRQSDLIRSPVNWLKAIADALDYLHLNGLVHRDVKPGNILLDDSMSAYLSDFGIAKPVASARSWEFVLGAPRQAAIAGSLPYLAPEVLQGNPAAFQSDQFALGISVYEFLTGRRPFNGNSIESVMHSQALPLPPLSYANQMFPWQLQKAIERSLHRDPSQRFPTCGEFAREVLQHWAFVDAIHGIGLSQVPVAKAKPSLPTVDSKLAATATTPGSLSDSNSPITPAPSVDDSPTDTPPETGQRKINFSRLNRKKPGGMP